MRAPFDRLIARWGSPATLYANDGASSPVFTSVVLDNGSFVKMLGTSRGDVFLGYLPSTMATVIPGQVLALGDGTGSWYLIAKRLRISQKAPVTPGIALALLALPLLVPVQRVGSPPAATQLDIYGEPAADSQGHASLSPPPDSFSVRAALANEFNPLSEEPIGPVPGSLTTLLVPLGCGLTLKDQITLYSTRREVSRLNHVAADGTPYALQAVVSGTVGEAFIPAP